MKRTRFLERWKRMVTMYKTFEVVNAYIGNYEIKAYENGRCVLDIILNDYNVDGACKVLESLGYQLSYRER